MATPSSPSCRSYPVDPGFSQLFTPEVTPAEDESSNGSRDFEIIIPNLEEKQEDHKKGKQKGHGMAIKIVPTTSNLPPSSYWRKTFALTSFPLILCGVPSYILLKESPPPQINSTRRWFRFLFSFRRRRSFPLTLLTCVLLLFTLCINVDILYLFVRLFQVLFIYGEAGGVVVYEVGYLVVSLCQVVAVDYFWLYGYTVKNVIGVLDSKAGRHPQVARWFRRPLVILMLIQVVIIAIRYSNPEYLAVEEEWSAQEVRRQVLYFSHFIFVSFNFPIYCTFCFAVRFELLIIKTFIYTKISARVTPNGSHLDKIKRWFTQAADHVVFVNHLYWTLLSVLIFIMFYVTWDDADTIVKLFRTHWDTTTAYIKVRSRGGRYEESVKNNATLVELLEMRKSFSDPETARKLYSDMAWVLLTFGFILYTVWQAVLTNDAMKELQNWIQDFVAGGGGADVPQILRELKGRTPKRKNKKKDTNIIGINGVPSLNGSMVPVAGKKWKQKIPEDEEQAEDNVLEYESESDVPLLWVGQKVEGDEEEDYADMFLKVLWLKNYIITRMKLDNPALLTIMLFGNLVPVLRDRLQKYNL